MLLEVALDIVSKWNLPAFASARVPEMVQRWREGRQLRGGGGGGGGPGATAATASAVRATTSENKQQHRSAVEFVVL